MSLIKIIANGLEIDYVKETLTIKKENNALIRSFKVSYSTFPFLIIENKNTKQALGTRDLTSINKNKVVQVTVFENDIQYYGELEIISYSDGFRKCNLKYATELLSIMNKKIAEFMPVVSINGSSSFPPFSEESNALVSGYTSWSSYVATFLDKVFPEVKWQFPTMVYTNKFGDVTDSAEPWHLYQNKINAFDEDGDLILNEFVVVDENNIDIYNRNVIAPQIFLLSPLFYALQSVSFKMNGSFVTSEFINRLLFLSFKDNISKVILIPNNQNVVFDGSWSSAIIESVFYPIRYREESFAITETTTYTVKYRFVLPAQSSTSPQRIKTSFRARTTWPFGTRDTQVAFDSNLNEAGEVFEGEFTIEGYAGGNIYLRYYNVSELMPISYEVSFRKAGADREYKMMHPTIQTGRYLPDWTFGTYLNELKKLFNLDIAIDDFTKKVTLNFNEDFIETSIPEIIKKSLAISSYEPTTSNSFHLKYDNDEDSSLWATKEGTVLYTNQTSDYSETLDCKFKFVPVNNYSSELSDDLDNKDGIGLMIYDEASAPKISKNYNGQSLSIEDVYEYYHKSWLKFRTNAGIVEMTGTFTKIEIEKIIKAKRIHIDLQEYVIEYIESRELKNENYEIKFRCHSITF